MMNSGILTIKPSQVPSLSSSNIAWKKKARKKALAPTMKAALFTQGLCPNKTANNIK